MSETYTVPYTNEQKEMLRKRSESVNARRTPITEATGALFLDCLGEIENTLQSLVEEVKKMEVIILELKNQ